ncbi:RING/U-box superfamily protein [Quillaja saponaria]|uniref:RING/U-box superfamily protein n=1 Tax=Quillaja saponaria TaxID=32244 RepID=A0AAD7LZQ7_QUISA|nr:RING/U-box superfamily protein [Quillaja saponaria]KAJ7967284.1 RING/U-box superfamily protein [Quillaja saponaria]
MGNACCVAAKDKTIINGSSDEILHRNIRYSPSWSFRWDNRGRVAGEDTTVNWFSDGASRNDGSGNKYESTFASDDGSPSHNFQRRSWQKSPISERTVGHMRTPVSDRSISRNTSMDATVEQVKESTESPTTSYPSPPKLSLSLPSTSLSTSPLSSQNHLPPACSTPRWPGCSPGHQLLRQVSDSRIPGFKSPSNYSVSEERPVFPTCSNKSARGSNGGSSDSWSMHAFSTLMGSSRRERWSFDSESFGFNREKVAGSSNRFSTSPIDLQTCGVCSNLLTEKSSWGSQKIIASNDLPVVAVLICGHVYHAECLENMTPEINKYDPACPICTFGEKQTLKLSEKALKAETEFKAKNKKSRNRVVDSDFDDDSVMFNNLKGSRASRKGTQVWVQF